MTLRNFIFFTTTGLIFLIACTSIYAKPANNAKKVTNSTGNDDDNSNSGRIYGTIIDKKCNCTKQVRKALANQTAEHLQEEAELIEGYEEQLEELEEEVEEMTTTKAPRRKKATRRPVYEDDDDEEEEERPVYRKKKPTIKRRPMKYQDYADDDQDAELEDNTDGYRGASGYTSNKKKNNYPKPKSQKMKPSEIIEEALEEEEGYDESPAFNVRRNCSKEAIQAALGTGKKQKPKQQHRADFADSVTEEDFNGEVDDSQPTSGGSRRKSQPSSASQKMRRPSTADDDDNNDDNGGDDAGNNGDQHSSGSSGNGYHNQKKRTTKRRSYAKKTTPAQNYDDDDTAYDVDQDDDGEDSYQIKHKKSNSNKDNSDSGSNAGSSSGDNGSGKNSTMKHSKKPAEDTSSKSNQDTPASADQVEYDVKNKKEDYTDPNANAVVPPKIITVHQNATRETGILIKLVDPKKKAQGAA